MTAAHRPVRPGRPAAGCVHPHSTLDGYAAGSFGRARPGGPSRPVRLEASERRTDIEIRMWRFVTIAGRVVDEAGEPVVGAPVRVTPVAGRGARPLVEGETTRQDVKIR